MAKSADQIRREHIKFSNTSINNEIRKRLTQGLYFDEVRELEFIETRIQHTKNNFIYVHGGFVLDDDVVALIDDLRRKCVTKLRKDAAFELECYQKRKAKGEPLGNIEYLRAKADNHTMKANEIQQTLDAIEAEKRRVAQQKAEDERRKAEQAVNRQKKIETIKKRGIIVVPIVIAMVFLIAAINELIIQPNKLNDNIEKFHIQYEEELMSVLDEYQLECGKIEYSDLVPDHYLDYRKTERINEYEIKVYISEKAPSYSEIYEILREVSYNTNDYLLSNTYEMLDDGAYVVDDSRETGFHKVITIFVFEDNSAYRIRYSTTLAKDGEKVWDWKKSTNSSSNTGIVPGGTCAYSGCDSNRAEGKYYCHIHKCSESGCNNSTMPHLSYCENHNCVYPGCGAARYKFAGSKYCQTHYVH